MIAASARNESVPLIKRRVFISNLNIIRVTRNPQHSYGVISLKGKSGFGRINFRGAGVDNAQSGQ
jgi:hypothetical protein